MYLKNQYGQFYQCSKGFGRWVEDLKEATLFTPEEARGTHFHKFNSNQYIEVI
jgi:hypothetical protein